MRFLDCFAGIGGFRLGMERARHTCVGHIEIDKFAQISYQAIHQPKGDEFNGTDITRIDTGCLPEFDILCSGFPCQSFSIAGKRRGFEDMRGTLIYDLIRIAKARRPRYLFFENVKGLLSHDSGRTFETILKALDEIGYDAEWQVLNSKHFGVPQNRERVFIIGHLRNGCTRKVFPIANGDGEATKVTEPTTNTITARYGNGGEGSYLIENQSPRVKQIGNIVEDKDTFGGNPQRGRVYFIDGISPCLNTMQGGGLEPKIEIYQTPRGNNKGGLHEIAPTITSNCYQNNNHLLSRKRIRRLTPLECFRLQGFPDWAFERAKAAGVSDSQLYKQAGNSVTVNVIYEIARKFE